MKISTKQQMNRRKNSAFVVLLIFFSALCLAEEKGARALFENYRSLVFQIQVIDNASGDKSSIGSGFQISSTGLIATNYHVVSQFVNEPERYRLQSIDKNKNIEPLTLLAIDVIHDLALVRINNSTAINTKHFKLADSELHQGDKIFSMGNPHDLGMTIIDGTYNGFLQASRFDRILFSGSLNAGMSGGPAFNNNGEVIGVNVAKGGEQLSFLVPVKHLKKLIKDQQSQATVQSPDDFKADMYQDIMEDQQQFYSNLLSAEWESEPMAELLVPGEISKNIRCWGGSNNKPKRRFDRAFQECRSQDNIYISRDLIISKLAISYIFLNNIDLNAISFAKAVELNSYHDQLHNAYLEEDITNFHCQEKFINYLGHNWKAHSCLRGYKKMAGLFDFSFVATSIDDYQKAAVINLDVTGASKENIDALLQRVLEEVKWPTP